MKTQAVRFSLNAVAAGLAMVFAGPAGATLGLMQVPPTAQVPPAPNVIVTLDDSGSMATVVPFDPTLTYEIPPGANGLPLRAPTVPPAAWKDGFVNAPVAVNLSTIGGAIQAAYNALLTAEARQNYVNWYSYYRTRNMAMKSSVLSAFSPSIVPDGRFRLAWQGLLVTCSNGFPANNACPRPNTMASFEGTHRDNFVSWVRSVPAANTTPLRAAYRRVGEYLRTTGVNSPWAATPGTSVNPILSCRRSYHVMFTDGQWNDGDNAAFGNADNTATTFPDGTAYTQNRPYRGPAAGGNLTLSDVAFTYWSTDLQGGTGWDNNVPQVIKRAGDETYNGTTITQYWNPKNNPATWQHLVMYGVGFGEAAALTPAAVGEPANVVPTFTGTTTGGASFAELVSGPREWPSVANFDLRQWDLWHAAVNTRGDMFPATNQRALNSAFQRIVAEILAQNTATGGAASSLSVVRSDFTVVRAGFEAQPNFRGVISGFPISGGSISNIASWNAQTVMGTVAPNDRVVLTASNPSTGAPFRWGNLSTFQQNALDRSLGGTQDGFGQLRVDYLRGATNKENSAANASDPQALLRWRQGGLIGTIVNSEPRFVQAPRSGYTSSDYVSFRTANISRQPVVYVGANDGMLHGFSATNGAPLISYVPRGVYTRLSEYTDPVYQHKYFVDGPVISADAKIDGDWRTVLVGGLGAGGRGIYALDVTNPANFAETNAASLVKFDYTKPGDAIPSTPVDLAQQFADEAVSAAAMAELNTDLGHIIGDPSKDPFLGRNLQIARMANDRWAVIIGNGVNSVNERAALYVFYLDAAGGFRKILAETTTGANNGLATPLPVDSNGDGKVDVVYAGDLRGRLWKFNVSATNDAAWGVAGGVPLYNAGRPITSAPAVAPHPRGGNFVTFGTGQLLTFPDKTSVATESIYGIWDRPGAPAATVPLSDLVTRTITAAAANTVTGGGLARVLSAPVTSAIDYSTKRGWRLDLGVAGERVIFNPIASGRFAFFSTYVPVEGQTCADSSQAGSFLAFDLFNGAPPATPVLDINGDNAFTAGDQDATGLGAMGRASPVGKLVGLVDFVGNSTGAPPPNPCAAVGSQQTIGVKCFTGPGRRAWRDLTP
jgi:type IV pilus assembly protein PilY1